MNGRITAWAAIPTDKNAPRPRGLVLLRAAKPNDSRRLREASALKFCKARGKSDPRQSVLAKHVQSLRKSKLVRYLFLSPYGRIKATVPTCPKFRRRGQSRVFAKARLAGAGFGISGDLLDELPASLDQFHQYLAAAVEAGASCSFLKMPSQSPIRALMLLHAARRARSPFSGAPATRSSSNSRPFGP
jgi:hypothetical protein